MQKVRTRVSPRALGWRGAFACLAVVLIAASNRAAHGAAGDEKPAEANVGERAARFVDQAVAEARATAGALFWQRARSTLTAGRSAADDSVAALLRKLPTEQQGVLISVLAKNDLALVPQLEAARAAAEARSAPLVADWKKARSELYSRQVALYEIKGSQHIQGQLASLLSFDNRWFWLFGVVAMASLILVASHERRHDLRRWLNGGRARALGLSKFLASASLVLALVTLSTFLFGDTVYHWILGSMSGETVPGDKIAEEEKTQQQSLADAEAKLKTAHSDYQGALSRWRKSWPQDQTLAEVVDRAQAEIEAMGQLAQAVAVTGAVTKRLKDDIALLQDARTKLEDNAAKQQAFSRQQRWIRGGLGGGLLGLVAFTGLLFARGVRRRRVKISNTCPLCLGQGQFEEVDEGSSAYPGTQMVRCKNVVSEVPFTECDFTFASMYRETVKLCFPTLGVPSSGKTHWLAMTYRELNRGNYPELVQFERIRSLGSEQFDRVIDDILNAKVGPLGTQTERVPHPLVFNFLDHDRFGISNLLVNIFDYSGEVTSNERYRGSRERARALDGDGFFFFLDPTRPSEEQSEALAGVREDLRQIKGVKTGKQIHVPIALCVSKIDLMVTQPYADPYGAGLVEKFYHDLGELPWNLDVPTLEARSKMMAELRDMIWPGWQIERQIDDLFGGRFMFFPLTPVGLEGAGEEDLSRRTIAPLGILEPLLWLLHMNGYPVLA